MKARWTPCEANWQPTRSRGSMTTCFSRTTTNRYGFYLRCLNAWHWGAELENITHIYTLAKLWFMLNICVLRPTICYVPLHVLHVPLDVLHPTRCVTSHYMCYVPHVLHPTRCVTSHYMCYVPLDVLRPTTCVTSH